MYGAFLGDIIGSPYEFTEGKEALNFPLFRRRSHFTDDSVMTAAVAEALMKAADDGLLEDEAAVKKLLTDAMKKWGRQYPNAGYGGRFIGWLMSDSKDPYYSYGNGSAMRVSPAGWISEDLEDRSLDRRGNSQSSGGHQGSRVNGRRHISGKDRSRQGLYQGLCGP